VRRTLGLFGHEEQEATRIVIAGGGNIGLYVARTLEQRQSRTRVKIIESNRERAVAVADSCADGGAATAARWTRSCCWKPTSRTPT
jgi:glycine/D-amino acid oxidase-like deaminating enzyme